MKLLDPRTETLQESCSTLSGGEKWHHSFIAASHSKTLPRPSQDPPKTIIAIITRITIITMIGIITIIIITIITISTIMMMMMIIIIIISIIIIIRDRGSHWGAPPPPQNDDVSLLVN